MIKFRFGEIPHSTGWMLANSEWLQTYIHTILPKGYSKLVTKTGKLMCMHGVVLLQVYTEQK